MLALAALDAATVLFSPNRAGRDRLLLRPLLPAGFTVAVLAVILLGPFRQFLSLLTYSCERCPARTAVLAAVPTMNRSPPTTVWLPRWSTITDTAGRPGLIDSTGNPLAPASVLDRQSTARPGDPFWAVTVENPLGSDGQYRRWQVQDGYVLLRRTRSPALARRLSPQAARSAVRSGPAPWLAVRRRCAGPVPGTPRPLL